jgi:hypothetical protein
VSTRPRGRVGQRQRRADVEKEKKTKNRREHAGGGACSPVLGPACERRTRPGRRGAAGSTDLLKAVGAGGGGCWRRRRSHRCPLGRRTRRRRGGVAPDYYIPPSRVSHAARGCRGDCDAAVAADTTRARALCLETSEHLPTCRCQDGRRRNVPRLVSRLRPARFARRGLDLTLPAPRCHHISHL